MDTVPHEVQTALVSLATALIVGGSVSMFGAPAVFGTARSVATWVVRHRMLTTLGVSAAGAGGAWMGGLFGEAGQAMMAGLSGFFA
ncbi:hypothetical protein [Maricaulis sp.]|uniref:hypothetical protein n=1 Tax=Maricaulis sp. TaxID=1486257 RepID=UPI00262952A6|nr:hypothetical protein [Maricaulis sp.]